jgi:hypothetical protein
MMNSTPSVNRYRKEAERVRELAHTAASDGTRADTSRYRATVR